MVASQAAVRERGAESKQEAQQLQAKLRLIIDKTRELQSQVLNSGDVRLSDFQIELSEYPKYFLGVGI